MRSYKHWILSSLFFLSTALETKSDKKEMSCKQLLANTSFDLNQILNVEWKVIGYWNVQASGARPLAHIRFTVPTDEFVKRFSESSNTRLGEVNWSKMVMFAEFDADLNGFVFETKTPGRFNFHQIPHFRYVTSDKPKPFALKYLREGFLMALNCKNHFGLVLAPASIKYDRVKVQGTLNRLGFIVSFPVDEPRVKRQAADDATWISDQENIDLYSLTNDMKSDFNEDNSFF